MPRRNVWLLGILTVVCLACYSRANRHLQVLSYAMDQVERKALEKVGDKELFEGALDGMMAQLNDPHSLYIRPKLLEEVEQSIVQKFGGLGIEVVLDPETKLITVATPLFGTPAFEAGVRPGDRILRIDGRPTQGMSLEEATGLMRGEQGTPVVLTVLHEEEQKPVDLKIVRAEIRTDSVLGYSRKPDGSWDYFIDGRDKIAYVRITTFGERTADELRKVLMSLLADNMKGLVLDLRNNPGGLLGASVEVCRLVLESGVIVTTRGRDGEVRGGYEATGEGTLPDFPMAVLVNKDSASASEIVAACLQDHGRAVIVGQRSFGKGTVQEIIDLAREQGAIKLTTASYWRPSQKNINRPKNAEYREDDTGEWGVMPDPDCKVKLEGEKFVQFKRWRLEHDIFRNPKSAAKNGSNGKSSSLRYQTDVDPQLAKAVECVEKEEVKRSQGLPAPSQALP
jgi:carboxyl-terminal processing protease